MPVDLLILKIFGPSMLLLAVSLFTHRKHWIALANNMFEEDNSALLFINLCAFPLGLLIVLTHNIWDWGDIRIILTLLGWLIVIRTLIVVLIPSFIDWIKPLTKWALDPDAPYITIGGVFWTVLSLALVYRGYMM